MFHFWFFILWFSFSVIVLNDADRMSVEAQHTLRRTMEKYAAKFVLSSLIVPLLIEIWSHLANFFWFVEILSCRLILCCENLSKLIEPLRSRCLAVRVAAPEHSQVCILHAQCHDLSLVVRIYVVFYRFVQICEVLQSVAAKEKLDLPPRASEQLYFVILFSSHDLFCCNLICRIRSTNCWVFGPQFASRSVDARSLASRKVLQIRFSIVCLHCLFFDGLVLLPPDTRSLRIKQYRSLIGSVSSMKSPAWSWNSRVLAGTFMSLG
jgi:hypothetical protein